MNLKEALLLEGKSYLNYWKEKKIKDQHATFFGWNDSPEEFKKLMKAGDPTATEDTVGQYADWIIGVLQKELRKIPMGNPKNRTLVRNIIVYVGTNLKKFHNNKKDFKEKNIYKHDFYTLVREIDEMENKKATTKMKGAKPIFEFKGWKIIEIKSHEEACKLGTGSKWCITGKNFPEEFHKYRKRGPIFFVVKGNRRWAVAGRGYIPFAVYDEQDHLERPSEWSKENNVPSEVKVYLYRRYSDES